MSYVSGGQLFWLESHFEEAAFSGGSYLLMQCFSMFFRFVISLLFPHNM